MSDIASARVGDRVFFLGEQRGYTVQARGDRYVVCTKPMNVRHTVLYTVVDLQKGIRGTENLVFGMGAETREDCEGMLARLEGRSAHCEDSPTEVSHRNRVTLHVTRIMRQRQAVSA